ncbi:MAG: DUF58 domain-containing protein [Microbacteriaceae bacterium]
MAVSGRLVALLGLGAVPVLLLPAPWPALAGWLALVLALAAVDIALAGSPRTVRVERRLAESVRRGETVTAMLWLANTGRRTVRGVVRDAWPPSAGARPGRQRISVPAGERRSTATSLTPFRRGVRRADAVSIRSFGPLGLAARQAGIAAPASLRVLPPFAARRHLPSRIARLRELDGATPVMVRGAGTEFDSLRDYVRGDDVRSIDWRASARRRTADGRERLVVRSWRPERDRRVVILVDSGRTSAARVGDEPRLDTAFEAALLLAALASHAGDRVDVLLWDRRLRGRVGGAAGGALLHRMVTAMADVEPALIETDWRAVPALVRSVTAQRALVVLLSTADSPGAARGLLGMLPELVGRHAVVVGTVTDPEALRAASGHAAGTAGGGVTGHSTAGRSTAGHSVTGRSAAADRAAVYRAAAAERALLDASRVARAIRQLGADVVAGSPVELPPALADHYLALKAAGRL